MNSNQLDALAKWGCDNHFHRRIFMMVRGSTLIVFFNAPSLRLLTLQRCLRARKISFEVGSYIIGDRVLTVVLVLDTETEPLEIAKLVSKVLTESTKPIDAPDPRSIEAAAVRVAEAISRLGRVEGTSKAQLRGEVHLSIDRINRAVDKALALKMLRTKKVGKGLRYWSN
jgi:hypothetical protein